MIVQIPLDLVQDNPWQTRASDPAPEYVKELALDIARNGLMQHPVGRLIFREDSQLVDWSPDTLDERLSYQNVVVQLAFGHNRLAAYKWLRDVQPHSNITGDFSTLPVDLRILTNEQLADYAWSENEKRRDHTPYERALAIQRRQQDFNWTQAQVAEHLGLSRSAVANMLRLLKLPEDVLTALAEGKVSERVAMSLISLFDLPQGLFKQAEQGYATVTPSTIVGKALGGEFTSDMVRGHVESICRCYGRKLDDATWKIDDVMIVENVESPVCKTCPSRLVDRNLCLVPKCYEQKKSHAKAMYLEAAADACGILPLDREKSKYDVTSFDYWSDRDGKKLATVRASGCENLRLMYDPITGDRHPRDAEGADRLQGFPDARIVCCKREQFCTCLKGLEYAKTVQAESEAPAPAPASAEDLKELARAARAEKKAANQDAKDLLRETAERIATGLSMKNRRTWCKLARQVTYRDDTDNLDMWAIQVMIATKMADQAMPYEIKTYRDVLDRMNKLLAECGLDPITLPDHDYNVPTSEHQQPAGKTLMEIFDE